MPANNETLQSVFLQLYEALTANHDLAFPAKDMIEAWELILDQWIGDVELPLLVRRPSKNRGSITVHESSRQLIVSDNTPAHWVYKNVVLNNSCPTIAIIKEAFASFNFPLAILVRQEEKIHLKKSQVASAGFRLGNDDWKVAHIEPIALPRTKVLTIEEHITHHRKFLSLKNMYLIRKQYSGLAEVKVFNDIVRNNSK